MNNEYFEDNGCPKVNCRPKRCMGFEFFSIPASLGDDSEGSQVAPKNGDYCSALVRYENGGAVYLYSSEGIPIKLTSGTETGLFIPEITSDTETGKEILSWTNNVNRQNPDPVNIKGEKGEKGDKGDKGDPGTGIAVKGELPVPSDLPARAKEGDSYIIQGDLWVYTGTSWQNVGRIQGPIGPVGAHYTPIITEDLENDEVILSWTNDGGYPDPDPVNIKGHEGSNANAKVLKSLVPLSPTVGATTILAISNLDQADQGDISAPETEIYDNLGTVGVVTSFDVATDMMTVTTITLSPEERQGVRLGTVETPANLPSSIAVAEAMGWHNVISGDFAYVRDDPTHDHNMAEYYIAQIEADETIVWAYSHSINAGDYQLSSDAAWDGMFLTAGNQDGTWGTPILQEDIQRSSRSPVGYLLVQGSMPNEFGTALDPATYQLSNDSTMEGKFLIGGTDNSFGTPVDPDDVLVDLITDTEVDTWWNAEPWGTSF